MSTTNSETFDDVDAGRVAFNILIFLAVVGLGLLASILAGRVMSDLWSWFIVPLGAQPIGVVHAMGLSVLASFFTVKLAARKAEERTRMWMRSLDIIAFSVISSLFCWGFGALYHAFM